MLLPLPYLEKSIRSIFKLLWKREKEDPAILEYEGTDLDTDAFPDSAELVRYAEYIDTLNECSLDTGDNTLYLLEVLEFT